MRGCEDYLTLFLFFSPQWERSVNWQATFASPMYWSLVMSSLCVVSVMLTTSWVTSYTWHIGLSHAGCYIWFSVYNFKVYLGLFLVIPFYKISVLTVPVRVGKVWFFDWSMLQAQSHASLKDLQSFFLLMELTTLYKCLSRSV